MNNNLPSSIYYEGYTIALLGTFTDPWFSANDVCAILQYRPRSYYGATVDHVDATDRKTGNELARQYSESTILFNRNRYGKSFFINENGLDSLVYHRRNSLEPYQLQPTALKKFISLHLRELLLSSTIQLPSSVISVVPSSPQPPPYLSTDYSSPPPQYQQHDQQMSPSIVSREEYNLAIEMYEKEKNEKEFLQTKLDATLLEINKLVQLIR